MFYNNSFENRNLNQIYINHIEHISFKNMLNFIVFFLQDLNSGEEMMHTAIMGPPGMCKTTVSEIIAKIYAELGFLSRGHVVTASRADLIGQYLGETAIKTRDVLERAEGGVLLLDEAYHPGRCCGGFFVHYGLPLLLDLRLDV